VQTRALPFGSRASDHSEPYDLRVDARGIAPRDSDQNGSIISDVSAYEYVPDSILLPLVMR